MRQLLSQSMKRCRGHKMGLAGSYVLIVVSLVVVVSACSDADDISARRMQETGTIEVDRSSEGVASPDLEVVSAAYAAGFAYVRPDTRDAFDRTFLSQVSSYTSLSVDDGTREFIVSGEADEALDSLYRRFDIARGAPASENALLFIIAWSAYHGREAGPVEAGAVLAQIHAGQQQAVEAESGDRKRLYELLAAIIQRGHEQLTVRADSEGLASFRTALRQDLLAQSGNDLAAFDLGNEGFVPR